MDRGPRDGAHGEKPVAERDRHEGSGNYFRIVVTDNDAATISNPLSPGRQQQITYEILNDSGGRMGRLRWGSEFKLAGSFTNPGDERRRTISFLYDGSSWCEIGRAGADIA